MCQGNHPLPPLPYPGTTRCWGDPTCWSEHPQSPFSQSRSSWAALSAPNPWRFSSDLEILLFFFIKMYILPIFSFFHPKLATEKPSQGCPSPSQVLPATSQLCPVEHPGVERCWPRSPHPPPEFPTLRCFLQGFQSHLHGATALPTPRTHGLRPARCQHCGLVLPLPHGCVRARTHGEPPRPFRGSGCSRRAAGSFSFAKEPRGDPGMEKLGKLGGCVLARVLLETLWGHVMALANPQPHHSHPTTFPTVGRWGF